jgi:ribosomal protein S18 acetylase RimI-like enzyme
MELRSWIKSNPFGSNSTSSTPRFRRILPASSRQTASPNAKTNYSKSTPAGNCVSAATAEGVGEIESIFVAAEFRGQGIANELMRRALDWLDAQGVHTKIIAVAVGNERAYAFYERFGFFPRLVMLKQKDRT